MAYQLKEDIVIIRKIETSFRFRHHGVGTTVTFFFSFGLRRSHHRYRSFLLGHLVHSWHWKDNDWLNRLRALLSDGLSQYNTSRRNNHHLRRSCRNFDRAMTSRTALRKEGGYPIGKNDAHAIEP